MKNEKWDDVHGNTTPDDRMVAFLESPTDSYAILQLREDVDDNIPLMFANYSYLQKKEMEPEIDRYEVVYHGSISMSEDVNRQLEDLYVKFNIDHPDDFRGHSMSVSDIVCTTIHQYIFNSDVTADFFKHFRRDFPIVIFRHPWHIQLAQHRLSCKV